MARIGHGQVGRRLRDACLTRAGLALVSYLAVQIPESKRAVWNWDEWAYSPATGQVVKRTDGAELLPYNYVVFGVSRCDAP